MENLYKILKLNKEASSKEIKDSFLSSILGFEDNPDKKNKSNILQIINAFETLSDPRKRLDYNQTFFKSNEKKLIKEEADNSGEKYLINKINSQIDFENKKKGAFSDAILITLIIPFIGILIFIPIGYLYVFTQCEKVFYRGGNIMLCGKELKEFKNSKL